MKPDDETEIANLRAIIKDQASQLETLAAELAIAKRSNKELLEGNHAVSPAISINLLRVICGNGVSSLVAIGPPLAPVISCLLAELYPNISDNRRSAFSLPLSVPLFRTSNNTFMPSRLAVFGLSCARSASHF